MPDREMLLKSLRSRRERYRILTRKRKWPIDTHSILVMVVSMWHNFIRRNSIFEEPEFYEDLPDRTSKRCTPGNHNCLPCTGRDDIADLKTIADLNKWKDGVLIKFIKQPGTTLNSCFFHV